MRRERGTAIVVVSHYLGVAREIADRAVFLDRETQTVVVGTPDSVLAHRSFRASYGELDEACSHG
jgi:ABC-type glutathione transport system ATPase component